MILYFKQLLGFNITGEILLSSSEYISVCTFLMYGTGNKLLVVKAYLNSS